MADDDHVRRLLDHQSGWNDWRKQNPHIVPDLSRADLERQILIGLDFSGAQLSGANLNYADLRNANLSNAKVKNANMYYAHFNNADFHNTDLSGSVIINSAFQMARFEGTNLRSEIQLCSFQNATFAGTDLSEVKFHRCDFYGANFSNTVLAHSMIENSYLMDTNLDGAILDGADLSGSKFNHTKLTNCSLKGAKLTNASLVQTDLSGSDLTSCEVYGVSVWDIVTDSKTRQNNIVITTGNEITITVDNIEVAQFIYLLLRREKLRSVIDSITSKAVLILGRFTPERKAILEALADELRHNHLLPIIFDFEGSAARDLTETIRILAGMSMFVIVDVTNPKSSPLELQAVVPDYQIPFVTIIQEGEEPFAMMDDLKKYDWVVKPILTYPSSDSLRKAFRRAILDRAWAALAEIRKRQTEKMTVQSVEDFLTGN